MSLPQGWREVELQSVVEVRDSLREPVNAEARAKRQGSFPYYGANGQAGTIDEYRYEGEHVLVAEDGGYFDEPWRGVAYRVTGRFWVNNHAHVLRAGPDVVARFLELQLNTLDWMKYVSGTTRLKLTQAAMNRILLRLPPLDVQRRIVAKLDELLAQSRAAREQLEAVPALVEQYRQSVLAAAFRGDLTGHGERWPARRLDSLGGGDRPPVKAGPFGSALKKSFYVKSGYRVYGQEQVIADDFSVGDYFIDEERFELLRSCEVRPGDVLVSLVGTFGKASVVPPATPPGIINPRLVRLSLDPGRVDPHFVKLFLRSPAVQVHFDRVAHGGTMGVLNATTLSALEMPVPPLEVQRQVVRAAERHLGVVRAIDDHLAASVEASSIAERSLLAKAFRGELDLDGADGEVVRLPARHDTEAARGRAHA